MPEQKRKPVVLMILDGWGIAPPSDGNAIYLANTPTIDRLWQKYPHGEVRAYGEAVGLEKEGRSGSETAHENIGAGRVVIQDSRRISESIESGSFFSNQVLLGAIEHIKKTEGSSLHLMGLLSCDDSPHSKMKHLKALLELAKKKRIKNVYLHLFTDGRDSPPKSAKRFIRELLGYIDEIGVGEIATIGGRFYGMDRSKRWERLIVAYNAMVLGKGEVAKNAFEAVDNAYKQGITDEYILPTVIVNEKGKPRAVIKDGDSVIFFHFRSDRARQFTKLFAQEKFNEIKRKKILKKLFFVAFTNFGPDLSVRTAFPSLPIKNTLPVVLGDLRQLYIAETEKFAHVTYFFNGGYADPIKGEARVIIQSDDTVNYKDNPKMSAKELTDVVVGNIKFDVYDFITLNFANLDMVGHTGCIPAAIKAAEEVDRNAARIIKAVLEKDGAAVIIGDHGNADEMLDPETKESHTCHSKNPVPVIIVGNKWEGNATIIKDAKLCDIAPTILAIFGIKKPKEMTGHNLLKQIKE